VFNDRDDAVLVNSYAMAAAYSARDDGTVELPFDLATGELRRDVFDRWLEWDPVRMARAAQHAETLRNLNGVWIDAGRSDEYFLDLGAIAFHRAVETAGTPAEAIHFELFDGKHGGLTWRYPLALNWLVERLSG
jgi:hypothetical protein